MKNGKVGGWVAIAGFAVLAVGIGLQGVALYATYADPASDPGLFHLNDRQPIETPEPLMRLLFDRNG